MKEWNKRPLSDQTWANFKTHFCDVQIALRKTGDITINEGLNFTEIIDMVSEGFCVALQECKPTKQENNIALSALLAGLIKIGLR